MPPQDTIYISGVNDPLPLTNPVIDSLQQYYARQIVEEKDPHYLLPEWQMFLVVLIILSLLFLYYVYLPSWLEKRKWRKRTNELLAGRSTQYEYWLNKYNPYYTSLSPALRHHFIKRTVEFMESKEFRYHSMTEEEYIPVLISGAAVQLTFGLKKFLMEYFPVIHVIKKEYELKQNHEMYDGHVSRDGIHISWTHFMEGYENYSDSINVGLHEMAHALCFDACLGEQNRYNRMFEDRLDEFSIKGKPIFQAMREGASHVLDDYAATNFDEFWAVSVENFFENPGDMSHRLPDLYNSICDLLNQNPLNSKKIIDEKLAGLGI